MSRRAPATLSALARWWAQRPAREQQMIGVAAALVACTLLWTLGLAPAWRTLQAYPAQRSALDTQLQTMLGLQARAQALKAQPAIDTRAVQSAFKSAVTSLGPKASMQTTDRQATVTLRGLDAAVLASWLAQVRNEARLVPSQAQLSRDGTLWSGTLQFTLPGG